MEDYCVGLMSGTSMDGVDAAVCRFRDGRFEAVVAHAHRPYPGDLRQRLLHLQRELPAIGLRELVGLDQAVASTFADTARDAVDASGLPRARIRALGSHGQTVFHDPDGAQSSLQLGNPSLIAAATGLDTVGDFRRADIALGGHGAPLVPAFHHAIFASEQPRAVVNIGGIANITLLPDADPANVIGFDCGPGNGLMDEWAELHLGEAFDHQGNFAAAGRLHMALLEALLEDPYFARRAPKSSGRDYFRLAWVRRRYPGVDELRPADVQRTLCELTAYSIANCLGAARLELQEVLVCGGGVNNGNLMRRLGELLAPVPLRSTASAGLDPAWVEAAAFAWLALRRVENQPGNLPAVTGASRPAVLGGLYAAPAKTA